MWGGSSRARAAYGPGWQTDSDLRPILHRTLGGSTERQQPTGEQDAALVGREVAPQPTVRPISADADANAGVATLERSAHVRELPPVALAHPVIVCLVVEDQWHDALRKQIAAVDAGEALGDDGAYPEMLRAERGVLAT